ncbi:phospholipase D-like protein [Paraburkholderia sp. BL6665CI2N2]|uniref:phospholipase D-like domain-containing protein n=1 Tax=Paraburkholderia sp. BL6665CI2N2 TaxID=1938806 RepID=UPI00106503DD|nr:phospholipase D-like domain-containing protein [Paraburkholderia sp. BL6665CI2N2]TDY20348.1 phospholipase D-like protein [Paraburkholderia sp. BL6665CI2N2]
MNVSVRSYLSPTLVLLAFDWPEGGTREDFLGFAIKRTPGFLSADGHEREASSWLPNRLTFKGAVPDTQKDAPTNEAPIQKFMWWDARIDEADREKSFTYLVYPVVGTPEAPQLLDAQKGECKLTLPAHTEANIGSWFNRAVVSSQAFARKVAALHLAPNAAPSPEQALRLRTWLANDLQEVFALTLGHAHRAASAVYHLTDPLWAIPAFEAFGKKQGKASLAIVYDSHKVSQKGKPPAPSPNQPAVDQLADVATFAPRDKTHIMHDKFIVVDNGNGEASPARVLTGSANFTTEGITEQANVLHLFDSPELAALYSERAKALAGNPSIAATAKLTPGWSDSIAIGSAKVRVCFSPEANDSRLQIDTIVDAINNAKHSVVFCLFMPTDAPLRDACFAAADKGRMMFGLVNHISPTSAQAAEEAEKNGQIVSTTALANMELYHRGRDKHDVIDAEYFSPATVPAGFEPELRLFPGEHAPSYAPVIIHHKFLVIDAEGPNPIVYTGSANMSNNSEHFNDENLLEIRDRRIAGTYLAEFLRLYEHYRARALAIRQKNDGTHERLMLAPDGSWAKKYFVADSPEDKARVALAHGGD